MAVVTVAAFIGAIPNKDVRILPDTAAAVAVNQRPLSGALDSVREPRLLKSLQATTACVYRIPTGATYDLTQSYWMEFADPDTDVLRTPVVNDAYERYYWASPSTGFKYATKAQILAGGSAAGIEAGVGASTAALSASAVAGTGAIDPATGKNKGSTVTRSYLFTYVSLYGEEGAPSPPAEVTGASDQDFLLSAIPQPVTQAGKTVVTKIRIYRTVVGASGATTFNRVIDLAVGSTTYIDRLSDLVVSGNTPLDSDIATPPPAGMQGVAQMPNGVMVGFIGNNLYFSESYKPHSWPVEYYLTVPHPIVGLGVYGTTCVVCTQGAPASVTGTSGATMSLSISDTAMPCLSRQSIVVAPEGVYWATNDGLVLWALGSMSVVTDELIGREIWTNEYQPQTIDGVLAYGGYTAIRTKAGVEDGFTFPGGSVVALDGLAKSGAQPTRCGLDKWSNRPWLIKDGSLYEWLPTDTAPRAYQWRSKEFQTPYPVNMAALQAFFDATQDLPTVHVKIWADRRLVYDQDITPNKIHRLPGGFKADIWQVEMAGKTRLHKLSFGQSVGELKGV